MFGLSEVGVAAGLGAFFIGVYLASYCAGKGWFKAKLEFQRQHMKWMNTELSDDRPS